MRWHKMLFANHGASQYVLLLVASGVVLTLSMPSASRLSELILQPWHPFPLPFYLTHALLSAVIALSMGASSVPMATEQAKSPAIVASLVRIGFGQLLLLPLVAYSRVLFPGAATSLIFAALYILLLSVLMAFAGIELEIHATRRARSSFVLRFGFLALYTGLPLIALLIPTPFARMIALVSPIQTLRVLMAGSVAAADGLPIFVVPALLSIVFLFLILRTRHGRFHA